MVCRARPYEGELPYIFFSYCHQDAASVYPIIESMAERGYRIWYDDGIHPGDNWIETIAMHISDCSVCIVAVSSRSVVSHNCRNEVNFSIEHGKPLIPIIIEEFPMTLGVRLQLSSCQNIRKYEQPNDLEFFKKLFSANELEQCKGDHPLLESAAFAQIELEVLEKERERSLQKRAVQIRQASAGLQPDKKMWGVHSRPESETSPQDITNPEKGGLRQRTGQAVRGEKEQLHQSFIPSPEEPYDQDDPDKTELDMPEDLEGSVNKTDDEATLMEDFDQTIPIDRPSRKKSQAGRCAALVYPASAQVFPVQKTTTKIGRDTNKCDIVLHDYTVSSLHAEIVQNNHRFYLRDMDSANGTVLNGALLSGLEPVPLEDTAAILFAEEFCLFTADKTAEAILSQKWIAILKCVETDEIMPLLCEPLELGRANIWPGGTFSDRHASRRHGTIQYENGRYILVVDTESTNGTFLNGQQIAKGTEVELCENDEIRTGSVYHIRIHYIDLKIGGQPE